MIPNRPAVLSAAGERLDSLDRHAGGGRFPRFSGTSARKGDILVAIEARVDERLRPAEPALTRRASVSLVRMLSLLACI